MEEKTVLSSSLEDYIEAIYEIIKENEAVRAKDISRRLGVKNSSVTGALKLLAEKELINYTPYGIITLTDSGKKIARNVVERHELLTRFFIDILGIEVSAAEDAACKMEHALTDDILSSLHDFLDFTGSCPRMNVLLSKDRGNYCEHKTEKETCLECFIKDTIHAHAPLS